MSQTSANKEIKEIKQPATNLNSFPKVNLTASNWFGWQSLDFRQIKRFSAYLQCDMFCPPK